MPRRIRNPAYQEAFRNILLIIGMLGEEEGLTREESESQTKQIGWHLAKRRPMESAFSHPLEVTSTLWHQPVRW